MDLGVYEITCDRYLFSFMNSIEKPDFKAKKCYQTGVKPTGTMNGEWSHSACNFIIETLNDTTVYVAFLGKKEELDAYETNIYVCNKPSTNNEKKKPNDPSNEEESYIALADILSMKGYAFLSEKVNALEMLVNNSLNSDS